MVKVRLLLIASLVSVGLITMPSSAQTKPTHVTITFYQVKVQTERMPVIPDGQTAYALTNDRLRPTSQHSKAAANAQRLPQTGTVPTRYLAIIGGLLLVIGGLGRVFWYQIKS